MERDIHSMVKTRKFPPQLTAPQLIVAGFLLAILVGGLILMLPFCAADGQMTPFIDALFTATTSVCVTGLTTVTTATHWSFVGRIVILILIQLGGLGVITVFSAFMMLAGKKLNLRDSVLIRDQYNLDSFQGMTALIKRVLRWTFAIEGIGAVGYAFYFIPEYGLLKGIGYSIFHAISAFCNAGLDLIGDSSLVPCVVNPVVNIVTMFLIIMGSIGFIVLWDTEDVIRNCIAKKYPRKGLMGRLSLHSKLAYTFTGILLFGGFLIFLICEWNNPKTIGDFTIPQKLMASMFESVTTRTAGFAAIPQENFTDASLVIIMALMFIGGSPMGTAGGVKTTTVGIVIMTVWAQITGRKDTEAFDRKISVDNANTAITVITISVLVHILVMVLLLLTGSGTFVETLYEVVSALGTVGLTMGLTGKLTLFGKIIVIIAMYLGRIGPITMAIAFALKKKNRKITKELPEKRIIIG